MARATRDSVLDQLKLDAARIAGQFGLAFASIEAERASVKRRYGICYSDGRIRIRLHHATTRRPLKYSSLVNTLCHELAHLRHFDHGARFKAYYARILAWARREGIYRPGGEPIVVVARETPTPRRPRPEAPEQLRLFA
jgi:predicted metal-dependent hydrolase